MFAGGVVKAETPQVSCNVMDLDREMNKITGVFGDPKNFRYPEDEKQLVTFCKQTKDATKYAKVYADKCGSGTVRSILSVFAFSINQRYKRYCFKNAKNRNEILNIAKCSNTPEVGKLIQQCYGRFIRKLSSTNSIKNNKNRIPHLCCKSFELQTCFIEGLNAIENQSCTENIKRDQIALFEAIAVNLLNLTCDESTQSGEKCDKIDAEAKPIKRTQSFKSPFPLVLEIFENL